MMRFKKLLITLFGVLSLTACVSYSTPEGKLEVADIQYRQGSCRSSIINYSQSFGKAMSEGNFPIARLAIGRIKERAGSCTYGNSTYGSYESVVRLSKSMLATMDATAGFERDAYDYAVWVTDFSAPRITEDPVGLVEILKTIAIKNKDAVLDKKANSLLATENVDINRRNASANVASGRITEKTHDESTQLISSIGGALIGVGSTSGRNSTQMAALGTAIQGGGTSTNAASGTAQQSSQKNCSRTINVLNDAQQRCGCEGGKPEIVPRTDSTNLVCRRPSGGSDWTCTFYKDGSRARCAVR